MPIILSYFYWLTCNECEKGFTGSNCNSMILWVSFLSSYRDLRENVPGISGNHSQWPPLLKMWTRKQGGGQSKVEIWTNSTLSRFASRNPIFARLRREILHFTFSNNRKAWFAWFFSKINISIQNVQQQKTIVLMIYILVGKNWDPYLISAIFRHGGMCIY